MQYLSLVDAMGWVGAIVLLTAYTLNILQKLDNNSNSFLIINLLGGALLTINAYITESYPFFVVNLFWVLVSIYQLSRKITKKEKS
jgi:hypothetical protein